VNPASPVDPDPTASPGNEEAVSVDSGPDPFEIKRAPEAEWYPLSPGQTTVWLATQVSGLHAAYTVPGVYRLTGALDAPALRRAFEALLGRHESLRTAFGVVDGVPRQRPVAGAALDWSFLDAEDGCAAGAVEEFTAREFDLTAGRLLRVLLVREGAREHVLAVAAHHIAVDGWSMTVLIDQVLDDYEAYARGGAPTSAAPPIQSKDYAVWRQALLDAGGHDASRDYWRACFEDGVDPLDLPTDRPRPAVRTHAGALAGRTLGAPLLSGLRRICREERTTLFGGLSAVLRVLLARYTGQREAVLGTAAVTRPVPELYDQIGYYLNTVALRGRVRPEAGFRDLLRDVREALREGLRHHEYPFDRVVREAGAATGTDRDALFDVMVMVGHGWGRPSRIPQGLRVEALGAGNGHSKVDLTFFFEETPDGLRASVEYSTELFDAGRVERMLDHFAVLLGEAVSHPDRPVEALDLLPERERELVVRGFNRTDTAYDLETTVPRLFEEQAARTPDAVATVDGRRSLTFAELDERANAVAWTLREAHGVGAGDLVALHMERSVHLTAAVLGVLKAGGAYLPISTADPAERVAGILRDSGSRAVLVAGPSAPAGGPPALDVTDPGALSARTDRPPHASGPGDLAYCIYTSGSTGRPKGVLVEHRSAVNRLLWMADDLGLGADDVILQKTPYSFDVSVWELLLPGIVGAAQVMLRPGGESDPEAIRAAVRGHGVTTLHFVPSMLGHYLDAVEDGFAGVRSCVCSGEELGQDLARRFLDAAAGTGTRLLNYYGPTETAVDVTALAVTDPDRPVTLGRPVPNTRVYVLDERDRPCPVGVTGELCVSGVQVARGYLNRPELTAERFADDPFRPGHRIYRTGDLARWRPDGELVFLGRRDGQVKVRGHRIELGEVERALCDLPGVERAVVLALPGADGNGLLHAYLRAGADCPPEDRVRQALSARLPRYMVPSRYLRVEDVPVTRNGKTDRAALVRAAGAELDTGAHVAASTPVELALEEIWRSLLPVGRLGAADDFFAVGGHSLLALRLASRIERRFGTGVRAADVFTHRTIAAQARLVEGADGGARAGTVAPVARGGRHVLSHAQERMWFLYMLDPDSTAYHIRTLASLHGPLDAGALRAALADLVARHEPLRVTYDAVDGEPYQRPRTDLPLAFELVDVSGLDRAGAQDAVERTVREDERRPFRLREEPPVRFTLLRLGAAEHRLLTTLHHIAGDGWSLRILERELSALYARRTGAPAEPLPDLPVQYIDYAAAVRDPAHREAVEEDLAYWTRRLAGAPALDLATDVPDPGARPGRGSVGLTLSAEHGRLLRDLARRSLATPFEVAMAALTLLLSRLGDQSDVVVGYPVANRGGVELEGVVGLFLNTLVLRADLSGDQTFAELLERVGAGVHEGYAHQSAPFELLVERLNPVRRPDRTPVFDVMLNYVGGLREEVRVEGLAVDFDDRLFEIEAKFPLSLYMWDAEQDGDGGAGAGPRIELVYRTDLFSPARARTVLRQFGGLLEQVADRADLPLSAYSLDLPGPGSGRRLLERPLDALARRPVTELVARHAAEAPGRTALAQGDRTLSYGELVRRSEELARRLASRCPGPGRVVAVTGPRGIGFCVAVLGVLRGGAVLFPLDPHLPPGRREHLLRAARPDLCVHVQDPDPPEDEPRPRAPAGVPVLTVDARTGLTAQETQGEEPPAAAPPVDPDAPAYLFFTSGTTGAPRGVLGRHASLSHFLDWQSTAFGIGARDRCAQLTGASFDVMLRDTLLALVSGGTTVVPEPADTAGGKAVLTWLARERISVLHAVPTVLQSWLLDAPPLRLPRLRLTFLAGEPLRAALVERYREAFPDAGEIVNLYGPTETTLAKFAYRVPGEGPLPPVLPVGSPLPGGQGLVMRGDAVCGVGEPGEIVIRTRFGTFGYLDDPEANAAAFTPNPLRADPGDLLYRTGDIGRYRPDGLLEVLGRADHQVKINGVRVHPSETEHALAGHPQVAACVVVAHRSSQEEYHLVAYTVPDARADRDGLPARLRRHLTGLLPRAMVPAEFVVLDRIPTTPNGKPDRAALPRPRPPEPVRAPDRAPLNDTQLRIRDAWQTALGRPVPGAGTDFFEIGGTSLTLLRLHSLLEEDFPGTFRVAQLFTHPTVAGQARLADPVSVDADPAHTENEVAEHEF
jgi:amino acid adenylation domain-containing protein